MTLEIVGPEIGVVSGVRDWWDIGWNLVSGCSRVTEGCRHCTAEIMMARGGSEYASLRTGPHDARWTGKVDVDSAALGHPIRWLGMSQAPGWVFVCPMSDLFHEAVPDDFIAQAIATMARFSGYRYGLLTKRADRAQRFFQRVLVPDNVLIGASVESDGEKDRLDAILAIAARHRWVSVEPMLGPLDLRSYLGERKIGWVTFGPEIGDGRRECDPAWARSLHDQCAAANVPFFTKHRIDGREIRQYPRVEIAVS